jgi:hypothetical protein
MLAVRVVDFGMMPSVGDGSVPLHHHDPAIRLSAAGSGGLFALKLGSARPAGQRQQCSVREPTPVLSAERGKHFERPTHDPYGGSSAEKGAAKAEVSLASA